MTNTSHIQDSSNPKLKKRKERADDKVAQTEKALAKAQDERESAKKVKVDVLVKVNIPRVGSGAGETDISLHSSDFIPRGCPGNAPDLPLLIDRWPSRVLSRQSFPL